MYQGVQSVVGLARVTPLPYGTNCALALAEEHADKSREILACVMEGPVSLLLLGLSAPSQPTMVGNAAQVLVEQHPKPLDGITQHNTASLITNTTTITTTGSTGCSLAVLSTRLGQQEEQLARDRQQIDKLSQQLCDTTTQLAHISKVLDHLLAGHTPMATLAEVPAVPGGSSVSGTTPPGQASSLPQQSMPLDKVSPSASTFHIQWTGSPLQPCRVPTIQLGSTGTSTVFPEPDPQQHLKPLHQTFPSLILSNPVSIESGHSCSRPSSSPKSATTPTGYSHHWTAWGHPAHHHGWHLLQHIGTGYPSSHGISAIQFTDSYQCIQHAIRYSYHGQGDPQCASETTAENYAEWVYRPLWASPADFQFKYASVDSNNAFKLVHKDKTVLMWPRKKGKQIDCLSIWLSTWALYEQVMVYAYPQRYYELAYYGNFIMWQDKKFIWSAVQMYDIMASCTHHSCPFTTMDQALMATILDATAVKASAHKCFRCRGFNHLVNGCPFPQTASLEMTEITKKGCTSEADSQIRSTQVHHTHTIR